MLSLCLARWANQTRSVLGRALRSKIWLCCAWPQVFVEGLLGALSYAEPYRKELISLIEWFYPDLLAN